MHNSQFVITHAPRHRFMQHTTQIAVLLMTGGTVGLCFYTHDEQKVSRYKEAIEKIVRRVAPDVSVVIEKVEPAASFSTWAIIDEEYFLKTEPAPDPPNNILYKISLKK